jgi:predicted  nucleic acid-binding Zn-ribbon protein
LQKEVDSRLEWVKDLEGQIDRGRAEIERLRAEASSEREQLEGTIAERTAWAQRLEAELNVCREELQRIGSSKWFRAGAKLGVGPRPRGGE